MNWDALGAVAEALGALGIFVSLVYVAFQLKQNSRSINTSAAQSLLGQTNDINLTLASNRDILERYGRLLDDPESDPGANRVGWIAHRCYMNNYFQAFLMHENGSIPNDLWENMNATILPLVDTPGGRTWLRKQQDDYSLSFIEYVESQLSQSGVSKNEA